MSGIIGLRARLASLQTENSKLRYDVDRYREVYCSAASLRDALETIATAMSDPECGFEPDLEWAQEVASAYVDVQATCAGCVDEQCLDDLADEDGEEIDGVGRVPYAQERCECGEEACGDVCSVCYAPMCPMCHEGLCGVCEGHK